MFWYGWKLPWSLVATSVLRGIECELPLSPNISWLLWLCLITCFWMWEMVGAWCRFDLLLYSNGLLVLFCVILTNLPPFNLFHWAPTRSKSVRRVYKLKPSSSSNSIFWYEYAGSLAKSGVSSSVSFGLLNWILIYNFFLSRFPTLKLFTLIFWYNDFLFFSVWLGWLCSSMQNRNSILLFWAYAHIKSASSELHFFKFCTSTLLFSSCNILARMFSFVSWWIPVTIKCG